MDDPKYAAENPLVKLVFCMQLGVILMILSLIVCCCAGRRITKARSYRRF